MDAYYVSEFGETFLIFGGVPTTLMTLVKECRSAGINAFDYVAEIRKPVSHHQLRNLKERYNWVGRQLDDQRILGGGHR